MIEIQSLSFDEQAAALSSRGVGEGVEGFGDAIGRLRSMDPAERSFLAWSRDLLRLAESAARIERDGEPVVLGHLEFDELETFEPIGSVKLPDSAAYAVVDIDLGGSNRNVKPEQALAEILAAGRSPLTIDEGVALMLQQPDAIAPNWGFSLAGARRADQRVPALWVSEGRPKLGWCWDRNPHTWLGTASCGGRVAPAAQA